MPPVVLRFGGLVSLLFGVGVCFWGAGIIRDAYASQEWPTTEGTVLYSVIEYDASATIRKYRQVVYYAYSVDGVRYTSNRVGFGAGRTTLPVSEAGTDYTPEEMRQFMRDPQGTVRRRMETPRGYPAGKKLSVYYNPDDPKAAALESGATGETFLPLAGGLAIAVVGLLVAISGRPVG